MNWKAYWQRYAGRIDAMSLRERAMIFLGAALILVMMVNTFLIDPLSDRHKQLTQEILHTQQKTSEMQIQIQSLAKNWSVDPNTHLRARLEQLRAQSDHSGRTLQDIQSGLVAPGQMPALLEDILRKNRSLRLVALKTLPVQSLGEASKAVANTQSGSVHNQANAPQAAEAAIAVYQHGVEISVEGAYLDLLRYLTEVEALPWRMFWGKADLEAGIYPRAMLTLTLYTLSLDKAWLAI